MCGDWYDMVDCPTSASASRSVTSSAMASRPPPPWECSAAPRRWQTPPTD
ncbi:hypothetical protein J2X68_007458 [Streptomyces sp. 3330]|nr:hypothetical protein [Streptomyces sp. 3330]